MKLRKNKLWLMSISIIIMIIVWIVVLFPSIKLVYFRYEATKLSKNMNNTNFFHFSIDDTINIFNDLTGNEQYYDSIFRNKTLAYLKMLNEIYGIKVTLYCYYEDGNGFNLSQATNRFKTEFESNSDWLKVGFHSKNYEYTYAETDAFTAKNDYNLIIDELIRICGKESIERVVRLSKFQGNQESVRAMNECDLGIEGLLSADDERGSYFLTTEQEAQLKKERVLLIDDIDYFETDCRIESIKNISEMKAMLQNDPNRIVFTHEYCLSERKYKVMLEELLLDTMKDGYTFVFL